MFVGRGYTVCGRSQKPVIPNIGGFCRGEESALFSATADPSLRSGSQLFDFFRKLFSH
jgi:hypothetical protein